MIPLLALLMACGGFSDKDRAAKEKQLNEYKNELTTLKKKIAKLEKELSEGVGEGVVRVVYEPVKASSYSHYVDVSGKVNADKNILVSPEVGGNIVSIAVKEGDKVKIGQVLGRLNTQMLERAIKELQISYDLAKTTYERQKNLWDQNIGSEMDYLQARSQKESLQQKLEGLNAQLEMAVITSPINGVVDEVIQRVGEIAGPQMPFARIVNIDNVYITADVSEIYLQKIHSGELVNIEFPVIGKSIQKEIFRTSSVIDAGTRTFRIRVNLENPSQEIKPNMLAMMKLETFAADDVIVVPSILVKKDFTGEFLFTAEKDGDTWKAKKKYIETGLKDNNSTLVTSGLSAGDNLIVKGFSQVVDGSVISL
jgi:RND family efflux transporter MFP subunit